ncbi:site-specific integrase [Ruegeria sediminis]|nr:tyrosine-type recombinase/integrase [Ruegeria sediminis]
MAVMVKLKHVDSLKDGTFRFRRRYPKAVAEALGKEFMQERMKARDEATLVREQAALMVEYDRRVSEVEARLLALSGESPRERWDRYLRHAQHMTEAVVGPDDEADKRALLAEELHRVGRDPLLIRAVAAPTSAPPEVTLLDAKNDYLRLNVGSDRQGNQLVDRVVRRVGKFWGPLDSIMLRDLTREKARGLLDAMLADTKDDGKPLSPSTVKRELRCLSAMINVGLEEHGLTGDVVNPFKGLRMPKDIEARPSEARLPLPDAVVSGMRKRLKDNARTPAQRHLWGLLVGTGCRLAEVTGLEVRDVVLDHEVPHLDIRPNGVRSLKTKASVRKVPLVGKALEAATEAVRERKGAAAGEPLFPAYAKPRGADSASQALMKHMRLLTENKKHTVHSCRHLMKDKLRIAGVQQVVQGMILGHALGGVGEDYGGPDGRLAVCRDALLRVVE